MELHHLLLLDECLVIGNLIKEKSCVYEIDHYDVPRDQHSWVSQFSNNLHKPITYLYLKIMSYLAYSEETPIKLQISVLLSLQNDEVSAGCTCASNKAT
jgi:hypothetical protein